MREGFDHVLRGSTVIQFSRVGAPPEQSRQVIGMQERFPGSVPPNGNQVRFFLRLFLGAEDVDRRV